MATGPDSARISPTAHYTGQVWARNGLGIPELDTPQGRRLFGLTRPLLVDLPARAGLSTLQDMLLQRHRTMDNALAELVEKRQVRRIVEIASGYSARGIRFARRYAALGLEYIDADLPHMVAAKQKLLSAMPALPPGYSQQEVDALVPDGPLSLRGLIRNHSQPAATAVVMEGLLNYFDAPTALDICQRTAEALRGTPQGWLVCELHAREDLANRPYVGPFLAGLSAFARGRVSLHYDHPEQAAAALRGVGFDDVVEVERAIASDGRPPLVRVLAASVHCKAVSPTSTGQMRRILLSP